MRARTLLAWGVHLYTALGLVIAGVVAVLVVRGGDGNLRAAFLLLLVATVIDASDGTLARAVDVKRVLPGFSGRTLDDITDFHTYTSLPLLIVWRSGVLRPEMAPCGLMKRVAAVMTIALAGCAAEPLRSPDVPTPPGYTAPPLAAQ